MDDPLTLKRTARSWLGDFYFHHFGVKEDWRGRRRAFLTTPIPTCVSDIHTFVPLKETPRNSENCSRGWGAGAWGGRGEGEWRRGGSKFSLPALDFQSRPPSSQPSGREAINPPPFCICFRSVLWLLIMCEEKGGLSYKHHG